MPLLLGIPGSLRRGSYNRQLLNRLGSHLPGEWSLRVADGLSEVPPFNEDIEASPPPAVRALWRAVREADGVVFATPEYNQSLPGVLKNLLDWISRDPSGSPLKAKPCAVMGATVGAWGTRLAQQQLRTVLTACGAHVLPAPAVYLAKVDELDMSTLSLEELAETVVDFAETWSPPKTQSTQGNAHAIG
jgi:chromate reductase